ncbi:MAG: hypothetical protein NDI84_17710, partial [Steroidobacteraceae bacterium]|nr:hypothetical protein [Steroidobacteraceae bacterium]
MDPRSNRGRAATGIARPLVASVLMCWLASTGAQDLQVIELRHRLADEVIPALQPLLEPGGVITGMDATLFIRSSPGNFEQLRQAVSLLDRQPRQLRLTVGQGTVATEARSAVRGSATVDSGDVQVGVNRPPAAATGVAVTASHSSQRADLRNLSSVTTLEGTETHIATGQTTGYRDASTGFYATPRVHGDVVTLDLAPHQQRFSGSPTDRRVDTAGLTTQVSGRLGEWIRVGESSESTRGDSGGLLTWGTRSDDASYSVW